MELGDVVIYANRRSVLQISTLVADRDSVNSSGRVNGYPGYVRRGPLLSSYSKRSSLVLLPYLEVYMPGRVQHTYSPHTDQAARQSISSSGEHGMKKHIYLWRSSQILDVVEKR